MAGSTAQADQVHAVINKNPCLRRIDHDSSKRKALVSQRIEGCIHSTDFLYFSDPLLFL